MPMELEVIQFRDRIMMTRYVYPVKQGVVIRFHGGRGVNALRAYSTCCSAEVEDRWLRCAFRGRVDADFRSAAVDRP